MRHYSSQIDRTGLGDRYVSGNIFENNIGMIGNKKLLWKEE